MSRKSKTLRERAEAIFRLIDHYHGPIHHDEPLPKSYFQRIGLNPRDAEKWLDLIEFIQGQPKIKIIREGRNVSVQRMENDYSQLMRKHFMNDQLSFDERYRYLDAYFKSIITLERASSPEESLVKILDLLPKRPKVAKLD